MYLDRVKITIKSGNGGDGCATFYRDTMTMNGGPDGGDGGNGGDIIFKANNNLSTLQTFQFKKKFVAENGSNGQRKTKTGASGKNQIIEVPLGTVIFDAKSNKVVADLAQNGQEWVALKGGLGGNGNTHYTTSTRQAPKFFQMGEKTQEKEVVLELKTIADVGVVGYPNAGKSTLLSVVTNAKPKIASYQFTTIFPNLGVVNYYNNTFVMADIPGLIEGASEGFGLGHYFLKHIERVRMLIHLVDISESEGRSAIEDYKIINKELANYSEKLSKLKQVVVLSKTDLLPREELEKRKKIFEETLNVKTIAISSITHENIDKLLSQVWEILKDIPKPEPIEIEVKDFDLKDKRSLNIDKIDNKTYKISGGYIDNLVRGVLLTDFISFSYFQKRLLADGIIERLKNEGMKFGDTVQIKDVSFVYEE